LNLICVEMDSAARVIVLIALFGDFRRSLPFRVSAISDYESRFRSGLRESLKRSTLETVLLRNHINNCPVKSPQIARIVEGVEEELRGRRKLSRSETERRIMNGSASLRQFLSAECRKLFCDSRFSESPRALNPSEACVMARA
jgi:hypothetical protein